MRDGKQDFGICPYFFPCRFKGVHHLQKVMETELTKLERNRNDREVLTEDYEKSQQKTSYDIDIPLFYVRTDVKYNGFTYVNKKGGDLLTTCVDVKSSALFSEGGFPPDDL